MPRGALFNNAGTATTGVAYDAHGDAYVYGALPPVDFTVGLNQGAVPFRFPSNLPINAPDNVAAEGQGISVHASVSYQTLFMVASAADVSYSYATLPLTLTYANGTTASSSAAVSDWVLAGSTLPSDEASVYTNPQWVHDGQIVPVGQGAAGGSDTSFYVVSVPLDTSAPLSQVQLGSNANFHIWAMTLADVPAIAPPTLSLSAATYDPVPGTPDALTVHVAGPSGQPVSGASLTVSTTGGTVTPTSLDTGSNGSAIVTFEDEHVGGGHGHGPLRFAVKRHPLEQYLSAGTGCLSRSLPRGALFPGTHQCSDGQPGAAANRLDTAQLGGATGVHPDLQLAGVSQRPVGTRMVSQLLCTLDDVIVWTRDHKPRERKARLDDRV